MTSPENKIHGSVDKWEQKFITAKVHVQWDTERNIKGSALPYYSIQVGLSRHIIKEYVDDWIVKIEDLTPVVQKINKLRKEGRNFLKHIPIEKMYPLPREICRQLIIT